MTAPPASAVLAAVKRSGVEYVLEDGWDDPRIAAAGTWAPAYIINHHTANGGASGDAPSLNWVLHNNYRPIRACHFLIARSGKVHVVYAHACYHAGKGGPGRWGDGPYVDQDRMNHFAYGIEVESKGTSPVESNVDGFTKAQFDALAKLNAALLDMLKADGEGRVINHKTWAPGRKNDTLFADAYLQKITREARALLNSKPVVGTVKLSDLKFFRSSTSATIANRALKDEGLYTAPLRTYWGVASARAFSAWKKKSGLSDNVAAWNALGAKHGFAVIL